MHSSLKLGAYSRKERLHLVIKDWLFWKAAWYSLLSSLTFATTMLLTALGLNFYANGIQSSLSFYALPVILLSIMAVAIFPFGTFLEFLCAESEHKTIAEFSAESIKLDLKTIKKLNPWHIGVVLPFKLFIFIGNKCRQKIHCLV